MGDQKKMTLALEKLLSRAARRPEPPRTEETGSGLGVTVVFTSVDATLAALKKAGALANSLNAHITLVVPQLVPYPLPLDSPPVLLDFNERRFRVIASQSPVDTAVQIYLCRDRLETLTKILMPHSLVVLGARKKWWPSSETR